MSYTRDNGNLSKTKSLLKNYSKLIALGYLHSKFK